MNMKLKMKLDLAIPNYEVKLFLKPEIVLDSNMELREPVTNFFDMPNNIKMSIQYLDTEELELNKQGWIARVRKKENYNDKKFELTYKKRYPIIDGDIESALEQAALDGFDSKLDEYEAQVDWGYQKQTLSFSNKQKVTKNGYDGMELLTKKHAITKLIENVPHKFENWSHKGWGTDKLNDSRKYGPVDAIRWIGRWEEHKIYIEIWKIINENGSRYDYIVEVSFKTDLIEDATNLKTKLEKQLTQQGWFSPVDELKTQMALQRY